MVSSRTTYKKLLDVPLIAQTSAEESIEQLGLFRDILKAAKSTPPHPNFGWYPHDTLSSWWILRALFAAHFTALQDALRCHPVLDIGCGDGDLTFFLSQLGCRVAAVDHPKFNFNYMHGVKALKQRLGSDVSIFETDLDHDGPLAFLEDEYGLVLLLGILYHLKNPFSILERLSRCARYCMLSTRIASMTLNGTPMQHEALAYLLDSREANNDPTNFWIFSETGLSRLLRRTGWEVWGSSKHGCTTGSNPSSDQADERIYLFLRSRLRSAPATLNLSDGWWPIQTEGWCWVNKRFTIDLLLLESGGPPEFELRFIIHSPAGIGAPVEMACSANGVELESRQYDTRGDQVYRAVIPATIDRNKQISLRFTVVHNFRFGSETRDLGVIIPCLNEVRGTHSPIGFWVV